MGPAHQRRGQVKVMTVIARSASNEAIPLPTPTLPPEAEEREAALDYFAEPVPEWRDAPIRVLAMTADLIAPPYSDAAASPRPKSSRKDARAAAWGLRT